MCAQNDRDTIGKVAIQSLHKVVRMLAEIELRFTTKRLLGVHVEFIAFQERFLDHISIVSVGIDICIRKIVW